MLFLESTLAPALTPKENCEKEKKWEYQKREENKVEYRRFHFINNILF